MDVVVHTYFHFFQIASIVTLPFDVVKTRRQVELGELHAKNGNTGIISLSSLVNVCDGPKCGSSVEFQPSLNVFLCLCMLSVGVRKDHLKNINDRRVGGFVLAPAACFSVASLRCVTLDRKHGITPD